MLWEKEKKIKKNRIAIGTATQIIKEGVSDNIFNNIMHIIEPKEMWEKLWAACLQVGKSIINSILQELLNYLQINKPKRFEKPVMSIYTDVWF